VGWCAYKTKKEGFNFKGCSSSSSSGNSDNDNIESKENNTNTNTSSSTTTTKDNNSNSTNSEKSSSLQNLLADLSLANEGVSSISSGNGSGDLSSLMIHTQEINTHKKKKDKKKKNRKNKRKQKKNLPNEHDDSISYLNSLMAHMDQEENGKGSNNGISGIGGGGMLGVDDQVITHTKSTSNNIYSSNNNTTTTNNSNNSTTSSINTGNNEGDSIWTRLSDTAVDPVLEFEKNRGIIDSNNNNNNNNNNNISSSSSYSGGGYDDGLNLLEAKTDRADSNSSSNSSSSSSSNSSSSSSTSSGNSNSTNNSSIDDVAWSFRLILLPPLTVPDTKGVTDDRENILTTQHTCTHCDDTAAPTLQGTMLGKGKYRGAFDHIYIAHSHVHWIGNGSSTDSSSSDSSSNDSSSNDSSSNGSSDSKSDSKSCDDKHSSNSSTTTTSSHHTPSCGLNYILRTPHTSLLTCELAEYLPLKKEQKKAYSEKLTCMAMKTGWKKSKIQPLRGPYGSPQVESVTPLSSAPRPVYDAATKPAHHISFMKI
jgi:hypothetical protein